MVILFNNILLGFKVSFYWFFIIYIENKEGYYLEFLFRGRDVVFV